MKRIIIAEDEQEQREMLLGYLHDFAASRGVELECTAFADGTELVEEYRCGMDLLLLDIEMQRMDGITAARKIRAMDDRVQIVFITQMVQHALEGYEVQAADFLVKPLQRELFYVKMDRIFRKLAREDAGRIVVKTGSEQRVLPVDDVTYAETDGKHNVIHLAGREGTASGVDTAVPLYQLEKQLAGKHFFRCHSAYLVNLRYVTGYSQTDVFLGAVPIPLSKHRRKAFVEALTGYVAGRM